MARAIDSTALLKLVDVLASGQWQSGEALAAQSDITRAGLAKRMAHLREWGLDIETRSGLGYRLREPLERLDADRIRASLPAGIGLQVEPLLDSTNGVLAASGSARDPQVLLAEHQSAGRGRRGRNWQSPFAANLYASVAWNFALWPHQLPSLSLAVGVVCAKALQALGLDTVRLKWPNDLWLDQRKLGGILIEQFGEAGGACRVIVGIGINVSMQAAQAAQVDQPWTTVNEGLHRIEKSPITLTRLACELLPRLCRCLVRYEQTGFAPYLSHWCELDALRDRPVQVPDQPSLRGIGRGINSDGAFCIETADGLREVHAGDVSLRPG